MPIVITFSTWLTLFRIFLSPCVMLAIYAGAWQIACMLFVIAAFTDFLDGYCARLYDQESEFGKMLDPVADKILMFFTLFALYSISEKSYLPTWFMLLFLSKDLILICGGCYLLFFKKYTVISPSLLSKWVTALFMLFIVYAIMVYDGKISADYIEYCIWFFTINFIVILCDYSYQFYQRLHER